MMVVDASALIAILFGESDEHALSEALAKARRPVVSAVNYVEAAFVATGRLGPAGQEKLDRLIGQLGVTIASFDALQATAAVGAFRRYGKGNHPARLNLGDCAAYALAHSLDAPLLFKGDDFAKTDVRAAV